MGEIDRNRNCGNDLQQRLFSFSVKVILLIRALPRSKEYEVLDYQLIKSASSCGANYEEAQGTVSKADFSNKIGITLKEMRESNYWIRLIIAVSNPNQDWNNLKSESIELMNILGKIYSKISIEAVQ